MKALRRLALLVALATWLALPGVGNDSGQNGGGSGVWILPRPAQLCSTTPTGGDVRGTSTLTNVAAGMTLTTDAELGLASATLVDPITGLPVSLPVDGHKVTLPGDLLKALRDGACGTASVVISDSAQLGYVITITFDAVTGGASLKAH